MIDISALANQAAENNDFTKEEKGGFTREFPSEGPCFVRLREYVELGDQKPPEWKIKAYGKSKPKPQARWTFEIVAAVRKHPETGERYNAARRKVEPSDGDAFEIAETVTVVTDISKNGKAGHFKLFQALNGAYGMKYVHPAQLLDAGGWMARIVHGYNKDDLQDNGLPKPDAKPARLQLKSRDGSWTFQAPVKEDAETGETTRIKVPELLGGLGSRKIFLWDQPTKECWDSLFIDGERDEIKDGKETGKKISKNWIQETILKATNFKGSALDILLQGAGGVEEALAADLDPDAAVDADDDPLADLD